MRIRRYIVYIIYIYIYINCKLTVIVSVSCFGLGLSLFAICIIHTCPPLSSLSLSSVSETQAIEKAAQAALEAKQKLAAKLEKSKQKTDKGSKERRSTKKKDNVYLATVYPTVRCWLAAVMYLACSLYLIATHTHTHIGSSSLLLLLFFFLRALLWQPLTHAYVTQAVASVASGGTALPHSLVNIYSIIGSYRCVVQCCSKPQ